MGELVMSKILIIGGAGFIGNHLTHALSTSSDNQITICDNLSRDKMDEDFSNLLKSTDRIQFVESDLTDKTQFQKLDSDYDYVYMLAAIVGVKYTKKMPDKVIRVNSLLAINTLDWMVSSHCRKILFSSTSEAYAGTVNQGHAPIPTPEDVPLMIDDIYNPRYTYAITKILGESAFLNYAKVHNFETSIVRYHNIYGPRMGSKHVISEFIVRILDRESPFKVYGATPSRAFCYVSDAVNATIKIMESDKTNLEIFHIGNDEEEIKIIDLLNKLLEIADYNPELKILQSPPGSVNRRCPDISKLKEFVGFQPQVSLNEGLRNAYSWYEKNY